MIGEPEKCGRELNSTYLNASPYPHIVLTDFFKRSRLLEVVNEIKTFDFFDGEKEFFGSRRKRYCGTYEKFPPKTRQFIDFCNGDAFISFLEAMTGERGLVPDPNFEGGGIHSLAASGFLKIHADFNWNRSLKLYRRLNLIVYLNDGWLESWGGALELWDANMSKCVKKVVPVLGNAVVFTTNDTSFHGHPDPLGCPVDVTRDSIALYYYSAEQEQDASRTLREVSIYKPRGIADASTIVSLLKQRLKAILRPRILSR